MLYLTNGKWTTLRGTSGKQYGKVTEVDYNGVVWCPRVETGFWVARKDGKPFITGNTFPLELPETCILAGTSEKGCCPTCGAPWERITIKGEPDDEHKKQCGADSKGGYNGQATKDYEAGRAENPSDVKRRILEGMRKVKEVRWQPTCDCDDHEPIPCKVLDPFSGAGSTGVVCVQNNRRYIGIELNPEYVELSVKRIRSTPGATEKTLDWF